MSIPSRRRPPAQPADRADGAIPDVFIDMDHPFHGREDLNRWQPAFDFQLAAEGSDAPDDAEDDLERDDPPPPMRRVLGGSSLFRFLIWTIGRGLWWMPTLRN